MRVYSNFVGAMLNDEDLAKLTEKRIIQYEDKVKIYKQEEWTFYD
jgi:hypothetical protein